MVKLRNNGFANQKNTGNHRFFVAPKIPGCSLHPKASLASLGRDPF